FFGLCRRVFRVFEVIDGEGLYTDPRRRIIWKCLRCCPRPTTWVLLNRHFTLEKAFETCSLSQRLRSVLFGHGGVFALPAPRLSFHAYAAGTLCYHRGCYYPKNDMGGFVSALADTIKRYNGRVFRNRRVVSARATSGTIDYVKTQTSETFVADAVVVNFDPKT